VRYISLYTWSTENWNRAEQEVKGMMRLIKRVFAVDLAELVTQGYRVVVAGTRDGLPSDIVEIIEKTEAASANGTRATVVMCFNYGGQREIIDAVKTIVQAGYSADEVTDELVASSLYVPEIPPCDVIVRTSGEKRLSNFMLWRAAYSEFIFLEKNWPEMTSEDVAGILEEYQRRERRIGG
jgi:undecaprenyl diphosphate synthase